MAPWRSTERRSSKVSLPIVAHTQIATNVALHTFWLAVSHGVDVVYELD
jgi:hypothetical protein